MGGGFGGGAECRAPPEPHPGGTFGSMATQLTPNTVVARGNLTGPADLDAVNLFAFHLADATALTQGISDSISNLLGAFYLDMVNLISSEWTAVNCTVIDDRSLGGPEFTSVAGFPVVGAAGPPAMPNEVAAGISWRTALRGKSYRGRTYIPGYATFFSLTNGPNGVGLPIIQDAADDLIADAHTATYDLQVLSRHSGVDPVTKKPIKRPVALSTPVVFAVAAPLFWSQRGRRPGL